MIPEYRLPLDALIRYDPSSVTPENFNATTGRSWPPQTSGTCFMAAIFPSLNRPTSGELDLAGERETVRLLWSGISPLISVRDQGISHPLPPPNKRILSPLPEVPPHPRWQLIFSQQPAEIVVTFTVKSPLPCAPTTTGL